MQKIPGPIKLHAVTYETFRGDYMGICLACLSVQDSVEPDAEKYTCDFCEKSGVYGIELLLITNAVIIVDDRTPETKLQW